MNNDTDQQLEKYSTNASEQDIPKIAQNLDGMKRGPIKKIWDDIQALWAMVKDPTAAWKSKAVAIGALLYLVSPIDLIPDVIPVLGLTDDVGVIAAAVASLSYELKKYRSGYQAALIPPSQPKLVAENSVEFRLKKLDGLLENKIISQAEHDAKRQQILAEI